MSAQKAQGAVGVQEHSPTAEDWRDTKHLPLSSQGPSDKPKFSSNWEEWSWEKKGSFKEATQEGVASREDVSPMETL